MPISVVVCPQDGSLLTGQVDAHGRLAGNYEFVEVIGSGGMGVIYKARHPVLKRFVAIKMLHQHLMSETIIKRFQQEALAVSALSHPNIIKVHDFGISSHGQPYMVMDFVEGVPLSEIVKEGPMKIEPALNIFIQVSDALQHAHEKGVLHRDLKPSNIMVKDADCSFPEIKIVDFGIAKVIESDRTRVTLTGELMGTPFYMSPEQCRGTELDARSDIYSLGCVMFESLTGKAPFSRSSAFAAIVEQMTAKPPTLSETRPDIVFPELLEEILTRVLAKDPDQRYQSMSLLMYDLINVQKAYINSSDSERRRSQLWKRIWEQRTVIFVSLAMVPTLIFSAVWMGDIARRQENLHQQNTAVYAPVEHLQLSRILSQRKREIELRRELVELADRKKMDDAFAKKYLDIDIGIHELNLADAPMTEVGISRYICLQQRLTSLKLSHLKFTDTGTIYLRLLRRLANLNLDGTQITDSSFQYLGQLPRLRLLSLTGTQITGKGISQLKGVSELFLWDCPRLNDEGLKEIAQLPYLKTLEMKRASAITDQGVSYLTELPNLELLDLETTKITDRSFAYIGRMERLKDLDLQDCVFSAQALKQLSKLPRLHRIDAIHTPFNDSYVASLKGLSSLRKLQLGATQITDEGVASIARTLPELETLELNDTQISARALSELAQMKELKVLEIRNCKVADEAVDALKKARPKLDIRK